MKKCLLLCQVATSGLEKKMLNCYVATMPLPQTSGATYHICTVSGADGNHQDYGVNSTLLGKFAQYFVVVCLLMWNWNLSRQRFYLMLVLNCHHSSLSHSSPYLRALLGHNQPPWMMLITIHLLKINNWSLLSGSCHPISCSSKRGLWQTEPLYMKVSMCDSLYWSRYQNGNLRGSLVKSTAFCKLLA